MENDGINVLSLFDGMSCGRIALQRAGFGVDKYYSSEIDKYAITVADARIADNFFIIYTASLKYLANR